MKKSTLISLTVGSAFAAIGLSPLAQAGENPFSVQPLKAGYQVAQADKSSEAKCGANKAAEAKCGAEKKTEKKADGKCGEAKCGAGKRAEKKAEANCGANKAGEAKCGAGMK